ncbi:ATP-binding protein [Peribacillus sp. SCS-155]|uniref:ATP-binding protein n=1 Tax=Peribacillus sedimenti TaxID=3115297 RepID=UPI003906C7FB
MDFQYDKILLQMLMVLFPIILFLALGADRSGKRGNIVWGIVCGFTMYSSMLVPITIDDGIFLDLRLVPWFLAFIYGGTWIGIFVTIFFFIIRFLLGGVGMIPAFIVLSLSSLVMFFYREKYMAWPRRTKITYSAAYLTISSAMLPIIGTVILHDPLTPVKLVSYIFFVIANAIMIWFAIYMLESHQEKLDLMAEIQRNEKLYVAGQLAASVAHEIRNPMTSIKGFLQLLSISKNTSDAEKEYIKISLEELDRANEIISDYLSLGKNQSSRQFTTLNIGEEAKRSVKALSSFSNYHGVQIALDIIGDIRIFGISGRVQQLFINIIKNAIEASKIPGTVQVKVFAEDGTAMVRVSDNGEGMDKQQIQNLGFPFYSTKEKGTGLGLMVSLHILKEMGATFKVTSEKGKGTQFLLMFPQA